MCSWAQKSARGALFIYAGSGRYARSGGISGKRSLPIFFATDSISCEVGSRSSRLYAGAQVGAIRRGLEVVPCAPAGPRKEWANEVPWRESAVWLFGITAPLNKPIVELLTHCWGPC